MYFFFMLEKNQSLHHYAPFFNMIHTHFKNSIKYVRSNNEGKFLALKDFFRENEITHQITIPYTPQQNSRVENITIFLIW